MASNVNSGNGDNESYTPPIIVDAARAVLGGIDLDPASSSIAQQIVQARACFTADDDGLLYPWHGRIFLNPPNSRQLIGKFLNKLIDEICAGQVDEAIVIVRADTSARWFQELLKYANKICFVSGRMHFWSPDGRKASPTQGHAIVYLGADGDFFAKVFGQFGFVR